MLLSYGVDLLAAALGAKKFGASPRALTGAATQAGVRATLGLLFSSNNLQ
ncbi:MAG: hypothetical protein Q8L71_05035 [Thiobacillus sp.]|nr:hypothetical protein [Thiobacillus sp.]